MGIVVGEAMAPRDSVAGIVRFNARLAWAAVTLAWAAVGAQGVVLARLLRLHALSGGAAEVTAHGAELEALRALQPWAALPLVGAFLLGYCWVRNAQEVAAARDPGYRVPGAVGSFLGWVLPFTSWVYGPWSLRRLQRASGLRGPGAGAAYVVWTLAWLLGVGWWTRPSTVGSTSVGIFADVVREQLGQQTHSWLVGQPADWAARLGLFVLGALAWTAIVLQVRRAHGRGSVTPAG